ncbi:MAG: hypothetical protein QXJ17_09115 [Nitrososphaeria archaeon]
MAREDYTNFMEKTIYDLAVQAGYALKRVDKTKSLTYAMFGG